MNRYRCPVSGLLHADRSTTCGDTCCPNRLVTRSRAVAGCDAGLELAAQLRAHGAGEHAADEQHDAARELEPRAHIMGSWSGNSRRGKECNNQKISDCRDGAGESREPKIQSQRREDDENKIDQLARHIGEGVTGPIDRLSAPSSTG